MSLVLGFVGWPCSGKDVAAEYLKSRHNAMWWGHSNFIRAIAREQGIREPTTDQLSALFEARASHQGHGWIARYVTDRVQSLRRREPERMVVVTGVRNLDEVNIYRELNGRERNRFVLVGLEADRETRFHRWCDRPRASDGPRTWQQFLAIEALDGNRNVPDVLACAGVTMFNNGSLDELHTSLDALVKT